MRSPPVVLVLTSLALLLTTTPAFAYWDDVHYYLTYYIARVVGYTPEQAYRAAAADLSVDYCGTTEPTQMSAVDYLAGAKEDTPEKQRPRWMFHAFRDETRFARAMANDPQAIAAEQAVSVQLDALWKAAISDTSVNPGVYLHFVQDLGPHWGFGSAFGHYFNPADPVGSTQEAVKKGLQLGATVDWLGSQTPAPYKSVQLMTALSLQQFLSAMSPRQRGRQWADGKMDGVVARLKAVNDYPSSLQQDELSLYIAYVKSRKGLGTAPTLTPEQQTRFAKHLDGPDLNAAAAEIVLARKAAGMMEDSIPSHLQARTQFTFDASGNVAAGQLDAYVLTAKLKIIVPATGAGTEPFVNLVVKAPPTFWNDSGYDLVPAGGSRQVPISITYEQIPVGQVQVEVQSPVGAVLASKVVDVQKRWQEVTLKVGGPAAGPVWVLKEGFPKTNPDNAPTSTDTPAAAGLPWTETLLARLSPDHFGKRIVQHDGSGRQTGHDLKWVLSEAPPRVLEWNRTIDINIVGSAAPTAPPGEAWLDFRCLGLRAWSDTDAGGSNAILSFGHLGTVNGQPVTGANETLHITPAYQQSDPVEMTLSMGGAWAIKWEWQKQDAAPPTVEQPTTPTTHAIPTTPTAPTTPTTPTSPTQPSGPTSEGLGMTVGTKTGPDGKPLVVVVAANEDSPFAFT
ncbi:MAG: hypothetical protein FJX74_20315, partial [Armatimonadetes bacterium]|nr:hypothetical protein [Armatimonadota bacterium]